jgi:hypothetical protein
MMSRDYRDPVFWYGADSAIGRVRASTSRDFGILAPWLLRPLGVLIIVGVW